MIVKGDIFKSSAQTLVNPVNCKGVMGRGLAKIFKDRWPDMFYQYQEACRRGAVQAGVPLLFKGTPQILSVPTKYDWRRPSTYRIVEMGVQAIHERFHEWGITSLALPALGCGLGGLSWTQVKPLLQTLENLPIPVEIYEPQ